MYIMHTFQPNCTVPATGGGFVEGSNVRGTLEIVWSCFAIILLCTWSVIVPHVPEQLKETPSTGFKLWLREIGKLSYPAVIKVCWMLYTIVLPEYVLGKALSAFMRARYQAAERKKIIEDGGEAAAAESFEQQLKSWTISHTMLADLGGFVVDFRNLSLPTSPDDDKSNVPVLDKLENNRKMQEVKDAEPPDVTVAEGTRTVEMYTTDNIDLASQSSTGHNPPSRETISLTHEKSTQSQQDEVSAQPKDSEINRSENFQNSVNMEQNTSKSEDSTLTRFVLYLETSFLFLGGFDWEPWPDHRQIVNSLALEGLMGEWTSAKFEKWTKSPFYALCGDKWVLNAKQMWLAARMGLIALPDVTERDIQDKSKSNSLVTTLALVQIAQLVAALGSRYAEGISVSQLEAVALAYAVCAVFTYALQWSCPKDVGVPITTRALRPASREDILAIGREGRARWWWGGMFTSYTIPYMCTPYDSAYHDVGTLLGLAIFGAFHLIAWAFAFPTAGERLAWRIASIATAVIPLLILAVMVLVMRLSSDRGRPEIWDKRLRFLSVWPMAATSLIFVSIRMFMMVETFRSLYFLPPDGYIATDSVNMPSYG